MNEKIRFPCYTTRTGLRIGACFDAPPRRDYMNEDELFWQSVLVPTGTRLERLLPRPEALWKWAAIVAWIVVGFVLTLPKGHA